MRTTMRDRTVVVVRWTKFRLPYIPRKYHRRIYSFLGWAVVAAATIYVAVLAVEAL